MALPIFIQVFTVLPAPPEQFLKKNRKNIFSFIWDKKGDKIKRNIIINTKKEGGLQVPHIPSFCAALKISWLKKIMDINYISPWKTLLLDTLERYDGDKIMDINYIAPWKTLLLDTLERYGGDKILYLTSEGILMSLDNFNPFWKSTFEVWSKFERLPPTTTDEGMSQCIWLNGNIIRNGRKFILPHWIQKGIYFINDLLANDGRFLSFAAFRNTYLLDINFIDNYSIINAIKAAAKWQADLNLEENENWNQHFVSLYRTTKDTKLLNFQYKLFHRIIYTNSR